MKVFRLLRKFWAWLFWGFRKPAASTSIILAAVPKPEPPKDRIRARLVEHYAMLPESNGSLRVTWRAGQSMGLTREKWAERRRLALSNGARKRWVTP